MLFVALVSIIFSFGEASLRRPVMHEYNRVFYRENMTFAELKREYLHPTRKTVNKHLFIGVATSEECFDQLFQPALLGIQRHTGKDIAHAVFLFADQAPFSPLHHLSYTHNEEDSSANTCLEVRFIPKGNLLNESVGVIHDMDHSALNDWVRDMTKVDSFIVTNHFPHEIDFYWHDESKTPIYQGTIAPGDSHRVATFLGHVFSANNPHKVAEAENSHQQQYASIHPDYSLPGNSHIIDYTAVDDYEYIFSPHNRLETCELSPDHVPLVSEHVSCDNEDLFLRFMEFAQGIFHEKRIGLNFVQPYVVRPVTAEGFVPMKLPPATFEWLKAWYANELERNRMESLLVESTAGPCMNQHVAPSSMTHITSELKIKLHEELQPILESWYGKGPLKLTSIYGIRRYINGSVLRMHVDTAQTHVVSAIINVDQGGLEKDWPLLILDHYEREHNVSMAPGDMVLYESAKLLHGRPDTFVGQHYDNIFIHFKPISGWDYDWL